MSEPSKQEKFKEPGPYRSDWVWMVRPQQQQQTRPHDQTAQEQQQQQQVGL